MGDGIGMDKAHRILNHITKLIESSNGTYIRRDYSTEECYTSTENPRHRRVFRIGQCDIVDRKRDPFP